MQRRDFLRLFSASALAAIAPLDQLVGYRDERFVSPALGLSLRPPRGWHWPDVGEVVRALGQQSFAEDGLHNEAPAPLAAFYTYPEPHPSINPGIWIYADRVEPWMGSPLDLAANYLESTSAIAFEPMTVQPPTPAMLGGRPAASVVLQSRLVIQSEGFEHHVTNRSTIVYHAGHVIWLLCEESRDGPERAQGEFDRVLRSVRLT